MSAACQPQACQSRIVDIKVLGKNSADRDESHLSSTRAKNDAGIFIRAVPLGGVSRRAFWLSSSRRENARRTRSQKKFGNASLILLKMRRSSLPGWPDFFSVNVLRQRAKRADLGFPLTTPAPAMWHPLC